MSHWSYIRTHIRTQKVQETQRTEKSVENQEKRSNASHYARQVQSFNLVLINRAGGLYGRILTEVASTDRTQ